MATREEARAAREAKLEELHERLIGAVERLVTGEDWGRAMVFAARFRSRSFNNTLLIYMQHLEAFEEGRVPEPFPTLAAGYRQWQGLGRQVMKGQKGYQILAPVLGRFASSNPSDPTSWRRLLPREKPHPGELVRSKMVAAKPAYVWDVSQTEGEPIPLRQEPRVLEGEAPARLWRGIVDQINDAGFVLDMVPDASVIHGANGMTDYLAQRVSVREDMDPATRVKTATHELGHVRMHGPRPDEARLHRGIVEVEAESVALMVCAAHGMDTSGYTIPYVAGWAESVKDVSPVDVVRQTGERVRAMAISILDRLDTEMIGDGNPLGLGKNTVREMPREAPQPDVASSSAFSEPSRVAEFAMQGRGLV